MRLIKWGWLMGLSLLLGSSIPADWEDNAQYRRLPDPQLAESAATGSYILSAIDSFYAWELRRPDSFEELCASPYVRTLPCADLKNGYTGQPLKVGKETGDLVWTDSSGVFVAGTVDRAGKPWKRKDWDGMFKNIRDRREQFGKPSGYAREVPKGGLSLVSSDDRALWAIGSFLHLHLFLTFSNSCSLPADLRDFARLRNQDAQSKLMHSGASGPQLHHFLNIEPRPLSVLKNPITDQALVDTPEGAPGHVHIVWEGTRAMLEVLGSDGKSVFKTPIPHRACANPPNASVAPIALP